MVDQQSSNAPRALLIRAGRSGERDDFAVENGFAGGCFDEVADLTDVSSCAEMKKVVRSAYQSAGAEKVVNYVGQVRALRSRVRPGDLAVLPLKTTPQIAGRRDRRMPVPGGRRRGKQHVVSVGWTDRCAEDGVERTCCTRSARP